LPVASQTEGALISAPRLTVRLALAPNSREPVIGPLTVPVAARPTEGTTVTGMPPTVKEIVVSVVFGKMSWLGLELAETPLLLMLKPKPAAPVTWAEALNPMLKVFDDGDVP
jgi:hypothetical protein